MDPGPPGPPGPPAPGPTGPPSISIAVPRRPPSEQSRPPPGPKEPKDDQFYRYWDRFNATAKAKARPKSGKKKAEVLKLAGSLDVDLEGNPSHKLDANEEGAVTREKAMTSFEEATQSCKAKVAAIVAECKRLNQKYYDRTFDLGDFDTLVSLGSTKAPMSVQGVDGIGTVKRVEDIFEKPQFFIDGATADDVRQGTVGDCWFLAALTALSGKQELIERLCVARDEKVGVYGFVFYRDGEWVSEVVDDRLCVSHGNEHSQFQTEVLVRVLGDQNVFKKGLMQLEHKIMPLPKEVKESLRKGSDTLYFASCKDSNETWLPLIEKAYAKAHGDYQAIEMGITGEGIEDLTGGVSTILLSEDVLDKDKLWEELLQANDDFLFGCGSRIGCDSDPQDDEGFVRGHAYTVLRTKEMKDKDLRLLKIRNPWGRQEWNGAWSDGSKEWTAEMMKELDHTFGDDGEFWICFKDFLKYFPIVNRIRLFGPEWTVTQQWVAVDVPWIADYLDTKFDIKVTKAGPVVLVLSQPDNRYFRGLAGRYTYDLHFRVYKEGIENYLLRSMECSGTRSCSAELELEPGTYHIHVKVTATRNAEAPTVQEIVKNSRTTRRDKLLAVGKSFEVTHLKGRLRDAEKAKIKNLKEEEKLKTREMLKSGRELRMEQRKREKLRSERIRAEIKRKREQKKKELAENADMEKPAARRDLEGEGASEAKGYGAKEFQDQETKLEIEKIEEKRDATKSKTVGLESTSSAETPLEMAETDGADVKQVLLKELHTKDKISNEPESTESEVKRPDAKEVETKEPQANNAELKDNEVKGPEDKETVTEFESGEMGMKDGKDSDEPKSASTEKQAADGSKEHEAEGSEVEGPGPQGLPGHRRFGRHLEDDDDGDVSISSVDDDDFDWDSGIDGPVFQDDSDDDEDIDPQAEIFAEDPWNATCVIGVRVYSMDSGVEISVVHKSA